MGRTIVFQGNLRADIIQVYRILKKIEKLELSNYFEFHTRPSRHSSVRLIKPRALPSIKFIYFTTDSIDVNIDRECTDVNLVCPSI